MNKINTFKNIMICLKDVYEVDNIKNDLGVLKSLKLVFFISCNSKILQDVFSFECMPYGHIEGDLYNLMKINSDFRLFKLDNNKAVFNDVEIDFPLNYKINNEIITQINFLKRMNPNFFKLYSFDLIELNRQWYCYKKYWNKLNKDKKKWSIPCPMRKY